MRRTIQTISEHAWLLSGFFSARAQPHSQDNNRGSYRQRYLTSASNNVRNDIKLPDTQVLKTQDPAIFNSNSSSLIPMRHTLMSHISSPDVQQDIPSFIPSTFAMNNIRYREPRQWDAKRPYKPVHKKHRPVPATFPEDARVTRQFPEDPLLSLPYLSPNPPEFTPMPRLTQARLDILKINPDGFLWPKEEKLFIMVFKNNENALAYNEEERGTLRRDYFSDYIIPVVEHEPWTNTQNPIPPGIMPKVVDPRLTKDFMSQIKDPTDLDGFVNSTRMEDYDPSSIFRHSTVL